jgi:hypothetical protein
LPSASRFAIGPQPNDDRAVSNSAKSFSINAWVAQLVEHVTENHGVGGSIPSPGTTTL